MPHKNAWTRPQLLIAFNLYCQLPFGQFDSKNKDIIKWSNLIGRTPSALAMKLSNIASLDPFITSSGRKGLKGASKTDRAMWEEMQSNWSEFAEELVSVVDTFDQEYLADKSSTQQEAINYSGTNKVVETKVRVGQAFFRKSVLSAYDNKCCISGLSIPRLLIASHIVPWRVDKANRLNPRNGLALSTLHDKAFDMGMITINDDMTICVSKNNISLDDRFYQSSIQSFDGKKIVLPEKFYPDRGFLAYHREHVFGKYEVV